MAENRMTEVAALFGKTLGEEFVVVKEGFMYKVKFTEKDFRVMAPGMKHFSWNDTLLKDLITGQAEIVER